ncbi:MAG: hypothetical protein PHG03_05690 [Bacilli bacterium]|nr:hypothetical protein [Bacilli bacterium]MDD4796024.1 hypothetical protein [Bacilli bacterium]
MKKKLLITGVLLTIISYLILISNVETKFYLEEKYYNEDKVIKINIKQLDELINNKESFALAIYQDLCATSADFEAVVSEFREEQKLTFYEIQFSEIQKQLSDKIKHYPSFVVFRKGEVIDYLEPDQNEDIIYYQTSSGFSQWFQSYINLRKS